MNRFNLVRYKQLRLLAKKSSVINKNKYFDLKRVFMYLSLKMKKTQYQRIYFVI